MTTIGQPIAPVEITHRRVLAIALPMTLASVSTPLLGFADAAVIGQLGDAALLGAVALAAVIFDFVFWPFAFLRMGTTGLTAQAVGAGDTVEQRAALARALLLAAICGGLVVLLQAPIAKAMFAALGPSPAVEHAARRYYDIRVWSAPVAFANYAILGWFLGQGRATLGLLLQVFLNATNIVLNLTFVLGLGWSVEGTAAGTLLGECATLLVGLALVKRALRGEVRPPWSRVLDRSRIVATISINRDVFLRTVMLLTAYLFFASQGARAGDATLAANAVLNNLFLIGGYFLDGFATAAEALCGAAVGARNLSAFRRATMLSLGWCLGVAAAIGLLFWCGGGLFIDFVAKSEEVRELARPFLIYAALAPLAAALAFTYDGVYVGATWGAAMRNLMVVAVAVYFGVFFLLSPDIGNHGLWIAFLSFLLARGLGQMALYPRLTRRTFAVQSPGPCAATTAASRPTRASSDDTPSPSIASTSAESIRPMRPGPS